MIIFDQETRQFSVVDKTMDALRVTGNTATSVLPGVTGLVEQVGKNKRKRARVGRYRQYLADKQAHKERMAMIAMGMDPSGVKSQNITYDRVKGADKKNKREYNLEKRKVKAKIAADRFKLGADQAYRMKQLESPK